MKKIVGYIGLVAIFLGITVGGAFYIFGVSWKSVLTGIALLLGAGGIAGIAVYFTMLARGDI